MEILFTAGVWQGSVEDFGFRNVNSLSSAISDATAVVDVLRTMDAGASVQSLFCHQNVE